MISLVLTKGCRQRDVALLMRWEEFLFDLLGKGDNGCAFHRVHVIVLVFITWAGDLSPPRHLTQNVLLPHGCAHGLGLGIIR